MNRSIRKSWRRHHQHHSEISPMFETVDKVRVFKRKTNDLEEIMPYYRTFGMFKPTFDRRRTSIEKPVGLDHKITMMSKACAVTPQCEDFGQHTCAGNINSRIDQYHSLLMEQYGFNPDLPDNVNELKATFFNNLSPKVENSSQYANPDMLTDTMDGTPWHNVDTVEDVEQFLKKEGTPYKNYTPKDIRISETPRVKIIAEKYSKFKKNNLELRKLEEKIVCVEYDVYDQELGFFRKPVQVMRAFFSIKTGCDKCVTENLLTEIPSTIKNRLELSNDDLKSLTEKEIEMIDEKIIENKPYLEDLKRVLRKRHCLRQKQKKSTLDLFSMYEMAKRDTPTLDHDFSNTNLLSKAELTEMKELILQNCETGGYGISRRTVKNDAEKSVKSDSFFFEMLHDFDK